MPSPQQWWRDIWAQGAQVPSAFWPGWDQCVSSVARPSGASHSCSPGPQMFPQPCRHRHSHFKGAGRQQQGVIGSGSRETLGDQAWPESQRCILGLPFCPNSLI